MIEQFTDRKEQIIHEARLLFARYGFSRCTTGDIASNCGLTKAALYHYFKSKEQIFSEVVSRESSLLLSEIKIAVQKSEDPMEQMRAFILTRFKKIKKLLNLYRISRTTGRELLPITDKWRTKFFEEESILLQAIIEDGIAKGRFRKIKVDFVSRTMIAAFKGIESDFLISESTKTVTGMMDEILDILIYGLVVKEKP